MVFVGVLVIFYSCLSFQFPVLLVFLYISMAWGVGGGNIQDCILVQAGELLILSPFCAAPQNGGIFGGILQTHARQYPTISMACVSGLKPWIAFTRQRYAACRNDTIRSVSFAFYYLNVYEIRYVALRLSRQQKMTPCHPPPISAFSLYSTPPVSVLSIRPSTPLPLFSISRML